MKYTQPADHAIQQPLPITLDAALTHVDETFVIRKILVDEGSDIIVPY